MLLFSGDKSSLDTLPSAFTVEHRGCFVYDKVSVIHPGGEMLIQTPDACLRSTTPDDPELLRLCQDEAVLRNLSETRRYPQPMPAEWVFRIEQEGQVIGEICLKSIRWLNRKAELSIFLEPSRQGQGTGRSATRAMIDFAFRTLNFHRLHAEVIEYNDPSRRLLEKAGFVLEGRLRQAKFSQGRYWDILVYGLLRDEIDLQNQNGKGTAT